MRQSNLQRSEEIIRGLFSMVSRGQPVNAVKIWLQYWSRVTSRWLPGSLRFGRMWATIKNTLLYLQASIQYTRLSTVSITQITLYDKDELV